MLGDVFLRSYDVIHDLENLRLGLVGRALTIPASELQDLAPEAGGVNLGVVLAVLLVLGLLCALFGAKIWYDRK